VPDCEVHGGAAITLAGYDLLGNHHGCTFGVSIGAEGNQIGGAADPIDPLLEIGINFNGGPTSTLGLLAGSPAINAGNPAAPGSSTDSCQPSDQRGVPRSDCDIGAYELIRCQGAAVNIVGTSGADVLRSDNRSDAILGLGGADDLFGGGGAAAICAGEGNDTAYGGDSGDRLFGQDGRDLLNTRDGVQGNDLANGGAGSDTGRGHSPRRSPRRAYAGASVRGRLRPVPEASSSIPLAAGAVDRASAVSERVIAGRRTARRRRLLR
jgi:hypothetical protein